MTATNTTAPVRPRLLDGVTPATVPGAPTAVSGHGRQRIGRRVVDGTRLNGGSAITGYTVTSSPGGSDLLTTASPCTVTGLTNGTAYTFTVTATNAKGTGPASTPSTAVTPQAVAPGAPIGVTATAGNASAVGVVVTRLDRRLADPHLHGDLDAVERRVHGQRPRDQLHGRGPDQRDVVHRSR